MTVHVAGRALSSDPRAAWRAFRGEVGGMPRALKAWFAFLLVLCAVGAVGALLALPPGWEVLGTSPSFEWGILIAAYVFFAITTSGLCLASSLGTVFGVEMFLPLEKRHAVLAFLCLITAFGIIALDLHYPIRMVLGAVLSPSPFSPMWWMGVFYGVYLVFLAVEVWSIFSKHWEIHRYACILSSITAVLAPTTLGAVFAILGARPYWHGAFTPPAMVTMALLSGTALLGVVFYLVVRLRLAGHERALTLAIPAIRLLLTITLVVAALVVVWQVLFGLYGIIPGLADATKAILVGPLALQFWVVRVGMGLVAPLLLLLLPRTRTPKGLFATCLLIFAGIFSDRVIFVSAGQIFPGTAVAGVVSTPFAEYAPTLVEIAIVLGAFGFFGLAYTLVERYMPMGEHTGHLAGVFLGSSEASHPAAQRSAAVDTPTIVAAGVAIPEGAVPGATVPESATRPAADGVGELPAGPVVTGVPGVEPPEAATAAAADGRGEHELVEGTATPVELPAPVDDGEGGTR
jgi:Ni/Fe-hydrogenase subunit HybB-like protein